MNNYKDWKGDERRANYSLEELSTKEIELNSICKTFGFDINFFYDHPSDLPEEFLVYAENTIDQLHAILEKLFNKKYGNKHNVVHLADFRI